LIKASLVGGSHGILLCTRMLRRIVTGGQCRQVAEDQAPRLFCKVNKMRRKKAN